MTETTIIDPREVRKGASAVRKHLTRGLQCLDARDIDGAYAAFEMAQHAAFETKQLISNGGKCEQEDA